MYKVEIVKDESTSSWLSLFRDFMSSSLVKFTPSETEMLSDKSLFMDCSENMNILKYFSERWLSLLSMSSFRVESSSLVNWVGSDSEKLIEIADL